MDAEQRRHFLGIVVKETERLTRLVNQVLDFSKLESGVLRGAREEVSLINVVQEALAATSQLSRDKKVSITSELPGGPVTVIADRDMLVQVIINLLSNAIKFCDSDIGRVHIRLASGLKEVRIEVRDNGPGIQPEERGHIFEKFHQLSDTIKGKPQGTGLGLAICKTIIENHGGHIWVESNDEKGSVFIFTLPVIAK